MILFIALKMALPSAPWCGGCDPRKWLSSRTSPGPRSSTCSGVLLRHSATPGAEVGINESQGAIWVEKSLTS